MMVMMMMMMCTRQCGEEDSAARSSVMIMTPMMWVVGIQFAAVLVKKTGNLEMISISPFEETFHLVFRNISTKSDHEKATVSKSIVVDQIRVMFAEVSGSFNAMHRCKGHNCHTHILPHYARRNAAKLAFCNESNLHSLWSVFVSMARIRAAVEKS